MYLSRFISCVTLALAAPSVVAQTSLKLGIPNTLASHFGVAAITFAEEVEQLTNGRYKVDIFPSGALGGEREMVESVQLGTLDLVIASTGPVGNFVPETLITDIPFLFRNYDHARNTLDGPIGQDILAKFPSKGLIALAWGENGFRHLTNSRRPINTPEDMRGLKVRTMENTVHMTAFRAMGAAPTPMAFPELFTALQQGTVDGQENPVAVITASKFGQVQKFLTMSGHVYSPALYLAAPATYNAMSEADRKHFLQAAKVGAQAMRKRVQEVEVVGVAELRKQGVSVVTDVDKAKFQEALKPAYAEYSKRFGADKIDRIRNFK